MERNLWRTHVVQEAIAVDVKKILVLCTGNSCRSQIAEGYLRKYAKEKSEIYSAGVEAHGLNKNAVETMAEDGIDISCHTSDLVDKFLDVKFDHVITVCDAAAERCPLFHNAVKRHHYNFPDPAKFKGTEEEKKVEFRRVRKMIKKYCQLFVSFYI